ncbi:MAG: hypothetical protein J7K72_00830 [Candidatus Aenigmarchaeota archaeon]|nr:hypothetical protein [Candidatus Aenigmarchaeota archaeon]
MRLSLLQIDAHGVCVARSYARAGSNTASPAPNRGRKANDAYAVCISSKVSRGS